MEIEEYIIADDRMLVERSLGGDDVAFEHLFMRYCEAMRRLFLQRSTSAEDTEDLLQETFIKVYINLDRYSPEYTFGQWVYTIARNTHI
ncbi:MAG: sigma-70 family RNA polymerase sigma factor, partial [Alistipes sp.]|nr:sigma-70 family RNA polymerase sigma factor [Alistipes sp.]